MNTAALPTPTALEVPGRVFPAWIIPAGAAVMLAPGIPPIVGLGAGIAVGLVGLNTAPDRTRKWSHLLLQATVVGLGAGMNLMEAARMGVQGFGAAFLTITGTLLAARWLGRRLGVDSETTLLIAAGTAICGGSAIAALAAALKPKAHHVTVALATIFLLNAVALLLFPAVGHLLRLGQVAFGWWAALAIHDTSSVVGAGLAYGPVALATATAVKLSRALWIIPLTLVLLRLRPNRAEQGRVAFPWFIAGFVAMMAARTLAPQFTGFFQLVSHGSQHLLAATLFLIGCGITLPTMKAVGVRPLMLGITLWMAVASATLLAARHGVWGN